MRENTETAPVTAAPAAREDESAGTAPALFFDAILTPHRSLTPLGFTLLMTGVALVSFTAGLFFLLQGAWPVFGFFGLDVLLIYLAFRANFRAGRAYETVTLTARDLLVRRVDAKGRQQSWRFEPYWVGVEVRKPDHPDSRVVLSSHGDRLALAASLTPGERIEFAEALRRALARWRRPPDSV